MRRPALLATAASALVSFASAASLADYTAALGGSSITGQQRDLGPFSVQILSNAVRPRCYRDLLKRQSHALVTLTARPWRRLDCLRPLHSLPASRMAAYLKAAHTGVVVGLIGCPAVAHRLRSSPLLVPFLVGCPAVALLLGGGSFSVTCSTPWACVGSLAACVCNRSRIPPVHLVEPQPRHGLAWPPARPAQHLSQ